MTVVQRATNFFDRFRAAAPPEPSPVPAPMPSPVPSSGPAKACAPWPRTVPTGKRERRMRIERRRADRRKANLGSPYGTERRTGHDDRQGPRRDMAGSPRAGIGLTRDYFSHTDPPRPGQPGIDIPAHLVIRFKN